MPAQATVALQGCQLAGPSRASVRSSTTFDIVLPIDNINYACWACHPMRKTTAQAFNKGRHCMCIAQHPSVTVTLLPQGAAATGQLCRLSVSAQTTAVTARQAAAHLHSWLLRHQHVHALADNDKLAHTCMYISTRLLCMKGKHTAPCTV